MRHRANVARLWTVLVLGLALIMAAGCNKKTPPTPTLVPTRTPGVIQVTPSLVVPTETPTPTATLAPTAGAPTTPAGATPVPPTVEPTTVPPTSVPPTPVPPPTPGSYPGVTPPAYPGP